jgi:hypothetical protein
VNPEEAIRAQLPRAAELMQGLSADQINWRRAEGSWSIAECIAHLNSTNKLYASSIDAAIAEGRRRGLTAQRQDARLGFIEKGFIRLLEPPYRLKFKAPSKFLPGKSSFTSDDLLVEWAATHERLAQLASDSQSLDWHRVKVVSPAASVLKVSLLCALMISPAHDRRHLWQGQQVRQFCLESTRSAG